MVSNFFRSVWFLELVANLPRLFLENRMYFMASLGQNFFVTFKVDAWFVYEQFDRFRSPSIIWSNEGDVFQLFFLIFWKNVWEASNVRNQNKVCTSFECNCDQKLFVRLTLKKRFVIFEDVLQPVDKREERDVIFVQNIHNFWIWNFR